MNNAGYLVLSAVGWLALSEQPVRSEAKEDWNKKEITETVIGIDLGTTYSCVGVYRNGQVEIIPNDMGNHITPSYVAFTPEGELLVGEAAMNQLTTNPKNTIFNVKRLVGRRWKEIQEDIKLYPYLVINKNNKPFIQVEIGSANKTFALEEILAMILTKMKQIAEEYLGETITRAVVSLPAYFRDAQRRATENAATIAGLNVFRIINDATSAAIAYGVDKKQGIMNVVVIDLGGGALDVTMLTIDNGHFEVLATNGDTHLGGEDFNQRVMDYYLAMYEKKLGKDIRTNAGAVQKLRRAVERAKRGLSTSTEVIIKIESFVNGIDFHEKLTRSKFEELCLDLFRGSVTAIKKVLQDAKIDRSQVQEIVLVGGSTRIVKVQSIVKDFFSKEPCLSPDESVAAGAAILAAVIKREVKDFLLVDINPYNLGTAVKSGQMDTIIKRNTPIPTTRTKEYIPATAEQQSVSIDVYEGDRALVKDNYLLGEFELDIEPPTYAGAPNEIYVTFTIDVNGILKVSAKDANTGHEKEIVINDLSRLSSAEISQMREKAEQIAEEDKIVKKRNKALNDFEYYLEYLLIKINSGSGAVQNVPNDEKYALKSFVLRQISWVNKNRGAETNEILEQRARVVKRVEEIVDNTHCETEVGDDNSVCVL